MLGLHFFLAIFSGGADGDLPAAGVDQQIHRMREERPSLHVVIGDEPKGAALRKDCGFIVSGAVFEGEQRVRGDLVAVSHLHCVSRSEHAAVVGTQFEESVDRPLRLTDRDALRHSTRPPGAQQQREQRAESKGLR